MRLYSTQRASENLRWNRKGSEKQGNALYIDDSLHPLPQVPPHVTTHTTTKQDLLQTSVFLWKIMVSHGFAQLHRRMPPCGCTARNGQVKILAGTGKVQRNRAMHCTLMILFTRCHECLCM